MGDVMSQSRYWLAAAAFFISATSHADVATVKTVQLSKVVIDPDIPAANQHIKGGTICLFAAAPIDFGAGLRTLKNERFERLFSATMEKHGFRVITKSSNLFEGDNSDFTADFLVGATFRPQSVDLCDSVKGQKGTLSISVEWQVYDRSKHQVVETATTQGSGQIPTFEARGLETMVDQAFTVSLDALVDKNVLQQHLGLPTP